jgi:hypothetical protein
MILALAFGGALFARQRVTEGEELYEADDDPDDLG